MKITYDSEADALYVELRSAAQRHGSEDIEDGVVADFDAEGHIIGIEILDASERLTQKDLTAVSYEALVSGKRADLTLAVILKTASRKTPPQD
jgi:uncharacterized protein YuzE